MWQRWNGTSHIFERSDDNGSTWIPLPLNASILSEGSLADARLSANVPLKNAANIFAGLNTHNALMTLNAGVKFPPVQVPSADLNVLDDYEEGTWTPVLTGTGGSTGVAHVTQVGQYVKCGRLVTVSGRVTVSSKGTITGTVMISGLPFTLAAANSVMSVGFFNGMQTIVSSLFGFVPANNNQLHLYYTTTVYPYSLSLATTDILNTFDVAFSCTYVAAQ